MKSYVYILTDIKNKRIKIGLSNNYEDRINNLKKIYETISLNDSYLIECSNNFSKKLEKILHFLFCDFSIQLDENLRKKDGNTEWFDISILNDVLKAIDDMREYNSNIGEIRKGINLKDKKRDDFKAERTKQHRRENLKRTLEFLKVLKRYIEKYRFKVGFDNGYYISFDLKGSEIEKEDKISLLNYCFYDGSFNFVRCVEIKTGLNLKLYINLEMMSSEYKKRKETKDAVIMLYEFFNIYFDIDIFSHKDEVNV